MEDERICQFEDEPVPPDSVYDYTGTVCADSLPLVIDNGNTRRHTHTHV